MNKRQFLKTCTALLAAEVAGPQMTRGAAQKAAPGLPAALVSDAKTAGPLKVCPQNPRYFMDVSGRAVFLAGSHTWANLQDCGMPPVPPFGWADYLRMMREHNHNFLRLWTWEQAAWGAWTADKILFQPTIYERTGPGKAADGGLKFDLTKFNPEYFERLRARTIECRDQGIYVAVMLFQGFSVKRPGRSPNPWLAHPFNQQNNVNGLDGDVNGDSVTDLDSPEVRRWHEAYLRKVVETVNDLDNVLYEVTNEGGQPGDKIQAAWDWWVVDTVHRLERDKPAQHAVGISGHGAESEAQMLASPAEWMASGSRDNPLYKTAPPAWAGKKVNVLDTDHLWGHGGTAPWVWKSLCRGYNVLLMDPWEPHRGKPSAEVVWAGPAPGNPTRDLNSRDDPTWEPVRRAMGLARHYAARMDLARAVPADTLASTGYCLADAGRSYLVYLPEGFSVGLDLSGATGALQVEWMHPTEGTVTPGGTVEGGKRLTFSVPFAGTAVLFVWKKELP